MSTLSTHILDTAHGTPAAGVAITLERRDGDSWEPLGTGSTDADGRATALGGDTPLTPGTFQLTFSIGAYLRAAHGTAGFYEDVPIQFVISANDEHLHVPLLISPFGYTTYRGS